MWEVLSKTEIHPQWIITRLSPNQWAIDEILRHLYGSEVLYVQQKFDSSIFWNEDTVGAQWVGDTKFGLKETPHKTLDEIMNLFNKTEKITKELLINSSNEDYY
jgi:hypothetical protein